MKVAEEEVDQVVNKLCDRIDVTSENYRDIPFSERLKDRFFRLEWIITHKEEKE